MKKIVVTLFFDLEHLFNLAFGLRHEVLQVASAGFHVKYNRGRLVYIGATGYLTDLPIVLWRLLDAFGAVLLN